MRNSPGAAVLLRTTRETLLDELLDSVPEERRHTLRMAANALAIAAREAEAGEADLVKELRLLGELYGEDVAQAAGVSVATVSRALRNLPNVADSTRAKVVRAAEELDYRADPAASRLAAGRSRSR